MFILQARNELIKIFENVLKEKRENLKKKVAENRKKDMTDLLLEVRDEDGQGLDDGCIIDLLIGFFFAGHETSAHSIMRAIMFLSENPETLQKAKVRSYSLHFTKQIKVTYIFFSIMIYNNLSLIATSRTTQNLAQQETEVYEKLGLVQTNIKIISKVLTLKMTHLKYIYMYVYVYQ